MEPATPPLPLPPHPIAFLPPDISSFDIPILRNVNQDSVTTSAIPDTTRSEVATYAEEHGVAAAQRYCKQKFGFQPPPSTVRDWRNKLKEFKKDNPSVPPPVQIFSPRKRGAPSLLGPVLEASLLFFITEARAAGSCVNAAIVVAVAYGLLLYSAPHYLPGLGGHIQLTSNWAKQWLSRRGWVKRKATTGHRHVPADFQQQKSTFLRRINNIILTHNIPASLVVNFDQTGIHLVPSSSWTMAPQGSNQVPIAHKEDKRQITGVLAGSAAGNILPPQLLYQGISLHFFYDTQLHLYPVKEMNYNFHYIFTYS